MKQAKPSASGASRHFTYRIPIRMTPDERRIIGKNAHALNRSISRYLVELATQGPSYRSEEKARLRLLNALFREAHRELKELLASTPFAEAATGKSESGGRVKEAIRLLAILSTHLEQRLE